MSNNYITLGPEPLLCKFNWCFADKNARTSCLSDTMQQLVHLLLVAQGWTIIWCSFFFPFFSFFLVENWVWPNF